jgi:3-hydroxyisobutyrate dehydrogenase-like beta-hydroxyacid dehydrogenase
VKEKVGFIGLGRMGQPMSVRLQQAGYSLTIFDVKKEAAAPLVEKGAVLAQSPAEVAKRSDVIISMIPDGKVLRSVALGKEGVLEGAQAGKIYIDRSTVDPETSAEVAEAFAGRGVTFLRVPVTGSVPRAQEGKLTILASGDKQAFDKCHDILGNLGEKMFYLGTKEESRYTKLMINSMTAATCQIMAEALAFGEKVGLDWDQMVEVLSNSGLESPFIKLRLGSLTKREFNARFTTSMMIKDYDLALSAANKAKMPLPVISMVRQFLGMLEATGRGNLDYSALLLLMEELGGVKR